MACIKVLKPQPSPSAHLVHRKSLHNWSKPPGGLRTGYPALNPMHNYKDILPAHVKMQLSDGVCQSNFGTEMLFVCLKWFIFMHENT